MLANVFTKTVRDRWKGEAIAAVTMAAMLLFGMAVYRGRRPVSLHRPAGGNALAGRYLRDGRRRQPGVRRHLRVVRRPGDRRPGDLHGLGIHRRRRAEGDPRSATRKPQEPHHGAGLEGGSDDAADRGRHPRALGGRRRRPRRAERRRDRDADRRVHVPPVRQRHLLRFPGPGRRGLDRQQQDGGRCRDGRHGAVVLRRWPPPPGRGLGERRQGVPLVLLRQRAMPSSTESTGATWPCCSAASSCSPSPPWSVSTGAT